MVPDLTLEVIYLNQPTDFKMEFELCGSVNARFLSIPVKSHTEFLTALSKSVVRSRAIITVGSFNPLDKLYIPKIIAKATGYKLQNADAQSFGITSENCVLIPEGSLPLVDINGNMGGCVLENNDQTIIMLTSDRELRHNMVAELVCPYLKLFAAKKTKEFNSTISPLNNSENNLQKAEEQEIPDKPQDDIRPPLYEQPSESAVVQNEAVQIIPEDNMDASSLHTEDEIAVATPDEADDIILPVTDENSNNHTEEPKIEENQENSLKENTESEAPKYAVLEQPETSTESKFDLGGFLIDELEEKEVKPKKTRPLIKAIISIILVLAVLLASYFGYDRLFQPMQRNSVYDQIRGLYGQSWNKLPEDMLYKFGKLYQTNSDIFGWLSIPNTNINLPVVSSQKKSASYYRTHLFEGSVNRYGTLYTSADSTRGGYNRNIVIYGKDTGDDVMLSELDKFLSAEHYMQVPTFTFDTLYFENKWKIFSAFKINSKNENSYIKTDFFDDSEFSEHINLLEKVSAIDTNIDVTYSDQIVTLVSQSNETAVIIVARRVRDGESPFVDVTGTTENYTAENNSDIPVVADPLKPIEDSSQIGSEVEDETMFDGASSRFEQQAPTSSIIEVKPTLPTVTSVPDISSKVSSNTSSKNDKVSSTGSVSSKPNTTTSSPSNSGSLPMLTVTNTFNGQKVKGTAIQIIAQNIEAEMGSSYHIEALKAQAVAAYSWLLNHGSAKDKYPSLPLKTPSQKCLDAVEAVAGQVAVYGGKVATTYYYAISAGKSAYSQDIWSSPVPYLVSVDSSVDKNVKGYQTQRKYSASEIAQKAKKLLNVDLTQISDKNKWFTCSYDVNGLYCTKIKIGNVEKKGTYLRDTFFNYDLRSSAYTISYNDSEDNFIFTVKGYGHGVGMSQAGANQYAKSGWSYEKILKHYYTGISLGTYFEN